MTAFSSPDSVKSQNDCHRQSATPTAHTYEQIPQCKNYFDFIRKKAESGESFVVVGRCSETKLKDFKGLVSLFILGDMDAKIKRIMQLYEMNEHDAKNFIEKKDKKRKRYHNYHVHMHWGDSRLYDLSINSSRLGIEKTIDYLEKYIRARMGE